MFFKLEQKTKIKCSLAPMDSESTFNELIQNKPNQYILGIQLINEEEIKTLYISHRHRPFTNTLNMKLYYRNPYIAHGYLDGALETSCSYYLNSFDLLGDLPIFHQDYQKYIAQINQGEVVEGNDYFIKKYGREIIKGINKNMHIKQFILEIHNDELVYVRDDSLLLVQPQFYETTCCTIS